MAETPEYVMQAAKSAYMKETGAEAHQLDGWIDSALRAVITAAENAREVEPACGTFVPATATGEMVDAWEEAYAKAPEGSGHVWAWEDAYKAMLAAAPTPPQQDDLRKAVEFVALWAWREDPPNANNKLTDSERLSAIKHYPGLRALATRSASAWREGE